MVGAGNATVGAELMTIHDGVLILKPEMVDIDDSARLNVFPPKALYDFGYGLLSDTELLTYVLLHVAISGKLPNLANLLRGKARRAMLFAAVHGKDRSTLRRHIRHIINMSAKEKMLGIHAQRIIAFMKNPKVINNGAVVRFVRKSMSGNSVPTYTYATVSSASDRSCPKPAFIWAILVSSLQEALKGVDSSIGSFGSVHGPNYITFTRVSR